MSILSKLFGGCSINKKIETCNKKATGFFSRGNVLIEMEKFDDALNAYEEAADTWDKLSDYLSRNQMDSESLDACNKAIEARAAKGTVYFNTGNYEDGIRSIDALLEIHPDGELNWSNRGVALLNLNRYEEAIEAFDKALEIDHEFAQALFSRGIALYNLERYNEAIESLDKAKIYAKPSEFSFPRFKWITKGAKTLSRSDSARACYFKGVVLSVLGRYNEALDAFDETLQIKPDYPDAISAKEEVLSHL